MTRCPIRSANSENTAIASTHSPRAKHFLAHKSSKQTANTCNINALPAAKRYVPIAYAPQESISVLNALVITLHAPKTIFQHLAEFSQKKKKMGSQ